MADISQIGGNIRTFRENKGLTQRALADSVLVSFQAISAWERGLSIPDLENAVRIADYFGVSVDALLAESDQSLFVGIDGGGTKTEYILFDMNGTVLKSVRTEGSNPNDRGVDKCLEVLTSGLEQLLGNKVPKAIFAGIGGASQPRYQEAIENHLTSRFHCIVKADTDAANVLSMGIDPDNSVAVICGTGSCVFVRMGNQRGRLGGWGYLLDQAGSAYDVGKDGLRHTLAVEDGLCEESYLTQRIHDALGGTALSNISAIYGGGRAYIADLAMVVLEAAGKGDENALAILQANADRLALLIKTAVERYGMPAQIVTAGSFLKSDIFRTMVEDQAGVKLELPDLPPVYGACVEAMRAGEMQIPTEFRQNFMDSYRRVSC